MPQNVKNATMYKIHKSTLYTGKLYFRSNGNVIYIRLLENYLCTFDFCIIKAPDDGRTIGGRNM